ncbi:MAG: hypothetical protein IPG04_26905 [Polyangiaceae bacterium]|nr:hypothetical protein [Polyangiaceae bacterium]
MSARPFWLISFAPLALACSSADVPRVAGRAEAPVSPSAQPSGTSAPLQPPPAASAAAVSPASVKLDFEVVDAVSGFEHLHRVEEHLLASAGYRLAVLSGATVTFHADTKAGLNNPWGEIFDVGGVFPEALFVTYGYYIGRASEGMDAEVYRARKSGYQRTTELAAGRIGAIFDRVVTTKDESMFVVGITPGKAEHSWRRLEGQGLVRSFPPPQDLGVYLRDVAALPTGEVVAVGITGSTDVLYHWGPSDKEPTVVTGQTCGSALRISPSGELLGFGRGGIHRIEGKACHSIESGRYAGWVGEANDAAFAPDGTLWVTPGVSFSPREGLSRWSKAGWEEIEMPKDARVQDVEVSADGQLYAIVNQRLLRAGGVSSDWQASVKSGLPKRVLQSRAAGKDCTSNVVVLFGFTKVTPDDYDFPKTREALKGQTGLSDVKLAVTQEFGKRYFVAMTPDFVKAQKLAAVVSEKVKGSKPQVVCAEPQVLRELKLDWKTGAVVK